MLPCPFPVIYHCFWQFYFGGISVGRTRFQKHWGRDINAYLLMLKPLKVTPANVRGLCDPFTEVISDLQ